MRLFRVGLASRNGEDEATGAAAALDASPLQRASFELLERVALLDAAREGGGQLPLRDKDGRQVGTCPVQRAFPSSPEPATWVYARSNGVALHSDWSMACERAEQELLERDHVLLAWLGESCPRDLLLAVRETPLRDSTSYFDWEAHEFPAPPSAPRGSTIGLFGFPRADGPLVFGYARRATPADALEAATREALQSLAFLWGEPLPAAPPAPAPTPTAHLDAYQFPARRGILRRWLDGAHVAYLRGNAERAAAITEYADLTPPWLKGRVHVVRALSGSTIPLTFGASPTFAHLPPELRVHPIP